MNCIWPVRVYSVNPLVYPEGLLVPCGKCIHCKIQKRNEWSLRVLHESDYHEKKTFLTLTYSDDKVPENFSLRKEHLQGFIKRLRNYIDNKIRYFACGEYGSNTERPHYHGILFGVDYWDQLYVKKAWNQGFISLGSVTPKSIQYVVKYIDKQYNGELADVLYDQTGRERPFRLVSQGLGKQYAIDNKEQLQQMGYISVFGTKHSIPRYYLDIAEVDIKQCQEYIDNKSTALIKEVLDIDDMSLRDARKRVNISERNKLESEINKRLLQHEKNLQSKSQLFKRQKI